jgi:hypothetical protein
MIKEWPVPMSDRRDEVRYQVTLEVLWQGSNGRSKGTISDMNRSGCYVLSGGTVREGEVVHLFVPAEDEKKVQFTGTVANHQQEIGFAVKFGKLSAEQGDLLDGLIMEHAEV